MSTPPAARTSGTVARVRFSKRVSTPLAGARAASAMPRRASVRSPVATTIASPRPAAMAVPAYAMDRRSATAVSAATGFRPSLATGSDSPVSADSSASRPTALDDAAVGGDDVAGLQDDEVAVDELVGWHGMLGAVAADAHEPARHRRAQSADRLLRTQALGRADRPR